MIRINNDISFNEFYLNYHDWLLKRLVNMTNNLSLSEDITQSTFLIIYLKYYVENSNNEKINFPKSFLFTIARNLLFNFYDHEKVIYDNAENFTLYSKLTQESSLNCSHLISEVTQLLEPLESDIFILWFFYGYTLKEISDYLHISPSRVFLKLKHSKNKLRIGLKNYN